MNIRQAGKKDIEQLALLNAQVQAVHVDLFPALFRDAGIKALCDMLRQKLNDESTIILVSEEEGQLTGYLSLKKQVRPEFTLINERRCGYIDQVCVDERHRKKGIFRNLLNEAKKIVADWGIDRIELDVWSDNQAARETFGKHGFETYKEIMKISLEAST